MISYGTIPLLASQIVQWLRFGAPMGRLKSPEEKATYLWSQLESTISCLRGGALRRLEAIISVLPPAGSTAG